MDSPAHAPRIGANLPRILRRTSTDSTAHAPRIGANLPRILRRTSTDPTAHAPRIDVRSSNSTAHVPRILQAEFQTKPSASERGSFVDLSSAFGAQRAGEAGTPSAGPRHGSDDRHRPLSQKRNGRMAGALGGTQHALTEDAEEPACTQMQAAPARVLIGVLRLQLVTGDAGSVLEITVDPGDPDTLYFLVGRTAAHADASIPHGFLDPVKMAEGTDAEELCTLELGWLEVRNNFVSGKHLLLRVTPHTSGNFKFAIHDTRIVDSRYPAGSVLLPAGAGGESARILVLKAGGANERPV
ncbi:hypothetical protein T484DRAFT_3635105 [Baffinella frigidus]|nr:hypothetical protein T484DRAFT_3635105 [Cryptophyta sp. CCMP2293]